ncbi:CPBP family intramembrane glutamic endopeptidase [Luteolibacter soli]|uniref:CPBP family intramembrane glutamic endopeptidase n=1 Tax=Luteolibacter soli TaxID=3135280 RepID=A0ABU9B141_9BACT
MPRRPTDVLKIFAYVAAALACGALLAPWLYQAGKNLAEAKPASGPLKFLASAAGRADFPTFFNRGTLLSALVLIFPLTRWLRAGQTGVRYRDTPWSLRRPDESVVLDQGQPLRRNPRGWRQLGMGFLLGAGLLLLGGWGMEQAGFFVWKDAAFSTQGVPNKFVGRVELLKAFKTVLPGAMIVALIEETLFRGVLLGIFLRALKAVPAIVLLSLLFAFVHFLKPPDGVKIVNPGAAGAGFELLGMILSQYAEPLSLISRFTLLAMVGGTLAYARYRTASLWLPLGIHFGWIVGVGLFKAATWPVVGLPESAHWWVGASLLEGVLPLGIVAITGVIVHFVTLSPRRASQA